jgi:hypothetical protein
LPHSRRPKPVCREPREFCRMHDLPSYANDAIKANYKRLLYGQIFGDIQSYIQLASEGVITTVEFATGIATNGKTMFVKAKVTDRFQ